MRKRRRKRPSSSSQRPNSIESQHSSGPQEEDSNQDTRVLKGRRAVCAGIAALIVGGPLVYKWLSSPETETKPEKDNSIPEKIPEDPKDLFFLDDSWRKYAQKENVTLQHIADTLFSILHRSNELLATIYPALPKGTRLKIQFLESSELEANTGFGYYGNFNEEHETKLISIAAQGPQPEMQTPGTEKVRPVIIRTPGNESLTLSDLSEETLNTVLHELAHLYNYHAGLICSKVINEGLATYWEEELNCKIGREVNHDQDAVDLLDVFPELWNLPLNAPLTLAENFRDWAQLSTSYYHICVKLLRDWETSHPGFLKDWVHELTRANTEKESQLNEALSIKEILQAGERISPGFYEYANQHPTMQVFGRNPSTYYLVRIKDNKIFTLNIRSGQRRMDIGDHYLDFGDILPSQAQSYRLYDVQNNLIAEITVDKLFSIKSIENLEMTGFVQTGEKRKIAAVEFTDSTGTSHRIPVTAR